MSSSKNEVIFPDSDLVCSVLITLGLATEMLGRPWLVNQIVVRKANGLFPYDYEAYIHQLISDGNTQTLQDAN